MIKYWRPVLHILFRFLYNSSPNWFQKLSKLSYGNMTYDVMLRCRLLCLPSSQAVLCLFIGWSSDQLPLGVHPLKMFSTSFQWSHLSPEGTEIKLHQDSQGQCMMSDGSSGFLREQDSGCEILCSFVFHTYLKLGSKADTSDSSIKIFLLYYPRAFGDQLKTAD